MGGRCESSDRHANRNLKPLHVAMRREDVLAEARSMVEDLEAWELIEVDDEAFTLVCTRAGSLLSAAARITIRVDGPEGIPSAVLTVDSRSDGRGLSRDRANVVEFVRPFERRIC